MKSTIRPMPRILASGVLLSLLGLVVATPSSAGVVRKDKGDSDWEFILTPYLWAIGISGTSQVGTLPPMDVDARFGDILENLNMALAAHMELHRGKWALVVDPMWASLEMEADTGGSVTPAAEVDIALVEVWGSYKVTMNWEILGGARWQQQDLNVDPGLRSPPFPDDQSFGVKDDWLDWFVGARFNYPFTSQWRIVGRGDVSFAGDSDKGYNASLMLNRKIRKTMMFNLGYRYMKTDYDNYPTYAWNVAQQGLVVGYTWSF